MSPFTYAATTLLIIATFVGCVVFIVSYRPFDLRSHGPAGRHLLRMSWALSALYGMTLLLMVVPLPQWLVEAITVVVLGWICWAVWERVVLHRRVKRDKTSPIVAERDPS